MKVIYIMGAGHVGSTIVDIVLGTHPQIESLGEISKFFRSIHLPNDNRKCSCGLPVCECPFWSQVREKWSTIIGDNDVKRYVDLQARFEGSSSGWIRLLGNRYKPSSDFKEYLLKTGALYEAIEQVGGKQLMVDSSLMPRRAYILSMIPGLDLHLIHLVRDGRGVIWSLMKPGKQILTKAYVPAPSERTTRYWISANLQSMWVFSRVAKDKRQLIRYEDFVTDPSATVSKVGTLVGWDLSGLVNGSDIVNSGQARHTVGGNRVRMQKDIQIKADFAWERLLPERDRRLFWFLAGWLARRFGYTPQ